MAKALSMFCELLGIERPEPVIKAARIRFSASGVAHKLRFAPQLPALRRRAMVPDREHGSMAEVTSSSYPQSAAPTQTPSRLPGPGGY